MKKKMSCRLILANSFVSTVISALIILFSSSCTSTPSSPTTFAYDTTIKNWLNWNVKINEHADPVLVITEISNFYRDSLPYFDQGLKNLKAADPSLQFTLTFRLDSCSCDRFLYNMRGDLQIQGSGNSAGTIPPPVYPPVKAGGGLAIIDDNDTLNNREKVHGIAYSTHRVPIRVKEEVDDGKILAIIDSGIDSTRFESTGLSRILWTGSGVGASQRNFTGLGDLTNFYDDDSVKHGSAVAAIALKQIDGRYPRLMILKILDSNGATNVFAATCALKFAIKHGASVINTSWGYYGKPDSVMDSYIEDARRTAPGTLIIAAAGNDTLTHDSDLCSTTPNGRNTQLGIKNLFYFPACFSKIEGSNVISVTGLSAVNKPCLYQNYSSNFVRLGVLNSDVRPLRLHPCCSFHTEYLDQGVVMEGSSFATPVVSGRICNLMLKNGFSSVSNYFTGITVLNTPGASRVTMNGQYIVY